MYISCAYMRSVYMCIFRRVVVQIGLHLLSYVCLYARRIVICADVYMQGVWIYKSVM